MFPLTASTTPQRHLGPTIVLNTIQVVQKRPHQGSERLQALPPELIDPLLQVIQHPSRCKLSLRGYALNTFRLRAKSWLCLNLRGKLLTN
jgi:hypothetical protein